MVCVAARLLPELDRLKAGIRQLDGAGGVHLLADDVDRPCSAPAGPAACRCRPPPPEVGSCRPSRSRTWLGATASAGVSFWVGIKACDQRTAGTSGNQTTRQPGLPRRSQCATPARQKGDCIGGPTTCVDRCAGDPTGGHPVRRPYGANNSKRPGSNRFGITAPRPGALTSPPAARRPGRRPGPESGFRRSP